MYYRMVSPGQEYYIGVLVETCYDRGVEIPHETMEDIMDPELTSKRANEIINELKFELGWK